MNSSAGYAPNAKIYTTSLPSLSPTPLTCIFHLPLAFLSSSEFHVLCNKMRTMKQILSKFKYYLLLSNSTLGPALPGTTTSADQAQSISIPKKPATDQYQSTRKES